MTRLVAIFLAAFMVASPASAYELVCLMSDGAQSRLAWIFDRLPDRSLKEMQHVKGGKVFDHKPGTEPMWQVREVRGQAHAIYLPDPRNAIRFDSWPQPVGRGVEASGVSLVTYTGKVLASGVCIAEEGAASRE